MEKQLLTTDFLDRALRSYSDVIGVIAADGTQYTYNEFNKRINQLSQALIEMGVEKGDRVAVLSPNTHWFLETLYAITQLGAIQVPLNYRLTTDDYEYILNDCRSKVLLADYAIAEKVNPIRESIPVEQYIGYESDQIEGEWQDYEKMLSGQEATRPNRPQIDENDPATINYTSGTTGDPKGVVRTHRTEHYHALGVIHHMEIEDTDTYLWTLPMFHCNGWGHEYAITGIGGTHVCQREFSAERTIDQICEYDVSYLCGAPVVLNRLIEYCTQRDIKTTGDVDVRIATGANAPPKTTIKQVEDEMGWRLIHLYGLTETAPVITTSNSHRHLNTGDRFQIKNKQGFAVIGVDIRVVDKNGNDVPQDDETMGEIVVQGNQVMDRYWKKPEETRKAFNDRVEGWFHTGDMATIDQHGMISIKDRKKDVIISGGENISSIEIEDVLYEHPEITKAAVIGIPHEDWQETPKAFIVTKSDSDLDNLQEFLEKRLANYKLPSDIEYLTDTEMPETATGKIQKEKLRERNAQ